MSDISDSSLEHMRGLGIEFPALPTDVLSTREYDGRQYTVDPFAGRLFLQEIRHIVAGFTDGIGHVPGLLADDGRLIVGMLETAANKGRLYTGLGDVVSFSGPVLAEIPPSDEELDEGVGMEREDLTALICTGSLIGFEWGAAYSASGNGQVHELSPILSAFVGDAELYSPREEIVRPRSEVLVPLYSPDLVSEILMPKKVA